MLEGLARWRARRQAAGVAAVAPSAYISIPLANLAILFAGILLTLAPHAMRLPLWITALTLGLFAWRAWAAWRGDRLPRKWLLFLLVGAGLFLVYTTNRTLFGRDAGVTMLVLFLGLKLMETRTERDVVVVTFLCYFLTLTSFFYSQSMPTALHTITTVVVLTAALVAFTAGERRSIHHFRTAGVMLAQAVPVMLVLFVLFPRMQGPLWALPQDADSSMTGLSDKMSPGTISNLSQSDAIAWRVRFEDPSRIPPRQRLYWRGPVLWSFDGRTWTPGTAPATLRYEFEATGAPIRYEVTLEPHDRQWLFGIDLPLRPPTMADATSDYQILARQPVRARLRYSISSYLDYRATGGSSEAELREAIQLPPRFNPRTVALGQGWRRELRTDRAILARATEFFRAQGFQYTLQPPLAGEHSADEFIFDSRRGFCEHFASAFAIAMRAAGVPTRVVTGYQGGEINPIDGYLVVRQADAHAWVESWIQGEGWVRVDPTALAVPVRLEGGLAAAMPESAQLPLLSRPDFAWLARMRQSWEAASNRWNQWVLGYNSERQRDLFSRLGMGLASTERLATLAFWGLFITLAVAALLILRNAPPPDPVQRAWASFCRKLARAGLPRRPAEGPLAFGNRLAAERPALADASARIVELYIELRYGADAEGRAETRRSRELSTLVRRFRT